MDFKKYIKTVQEEVVPVNVNAGDTSNFGIKNTTVSNFLINLYQFKPVLVRRNGKVVDEYNAKRLLQVDRNPDHSYFFQAFFRGLSIDRDYVSFLLYRFPVYNSLLRLKSIHIGKHTDEIFSQYLIAFELADIYNFFVGNEEIIYEGIATESPEYGPGVDFLEYPC